MVLVFDVDDNLITTDWKRARLPQATFASSLASHLTPCRDPPAVPPPQLRLRPASRPFRPAPHADRGETDPTNTGGSPPVRGCLMAASSRRHRVGCARRGSGGHRGGAPSSASVGVDGCTTRFPRRGDGRGRGRRGVGPAPTGAASRVESPPPRTVLVDARRCGRAPGATATCSAHWVVVGELCCSPPDRFDRRVAVAAWRGGWGRVRAGVRGRPLRAQRAGIGWVHVCHGHAGGSRGGDGRSPDCVDRVVCWRRAGGCVVRVRGGGDCDLRCLRVNAAGADRGRHDTGSGPGDLITDITGGGRGGCCRGRCRGSRSAVSRPSSLPRLSNSWPFLRPGRGGRILVVAAEALASLPVAVASKMSAQVAGSVRRRWRRSWRRHRS